jgi:uncharacterized protein
MTSEIRDNAEKGRFELEIDGQVVFASYRRQGPRLAIYHVEAPPKLRGTGAAGRLMQGVCDIARNEGRKVVPFCGYASAWIRCHRAYSDVLG